MAVPAIAGPCSSFDEQYFWVGILDPALSEVSLQCQSSGLRGSQKRLMYSRGRIGIIRSKTDD